MLPQTTDITIIRRRSLLTVVSFLLFLFGFAQQNKHILGIHETKGRDAPGGCFLIKVRVLVRDTVRVRVGPNALKLNAQSHAILLVHNFSLWYTMSVFTKHNRLQHSRCYSLGCYERRVTSKPIE